MGLSRDLFSSAIEFLMPRVAPETPQRRSRERGYPHQRIFHYRARASTKVQPLVVGTQTPKRQKPAAGGGAAGFMKCDRQREEDVADPTDALWEEE